jgi:Flp pilus assembly pilin Flp
MRTMKWVRNERGQTAAEYLGVVVVIAIVVGALVATTPGFGSAISSGLDALVCRIGGGGCGGGGFEGVGSASGSASADAGTDDGGGGNPISDFFSGAGDVAGSVVGGAVDFGAGVVSGTGELAGGLWDAGTGAAGLAYRSTAAYIFDREAFDRQWSDTGDFFSYVWNNPGEFGGNVVDALIEPFTSRFEGGLSAREAGELVPEILATIIPIGKAGKLGRLGRAAENADDAADAARTADRASDAAAAIPDDVARILTRSSLPALTGSVRSAFRGGRYEVITLPKGTVIHRAEARAASGPGAWLGRELPGSADEAEAMYNLAKWNNPREVVRSYELAEDITVYAGRVEGGTGYQYLLPRDVPPNVILRQVRERDLP